MKKSKYSESQIVTILKEAENGVPLEDLMRKYGFSKGSFYKWKAKYRGMWVSELKRLKKLFLSPFTLKAPHPEYRCQAGGP